MEADDQVFHGAAAVAHRLQNAGAHVVHDHRQRAHEINPEIQNRLGQHIRRGAHPAQNLGREDDAQNRKQHAGAQTQRHGGVHRLLQGFVILRTVKPGHQHARTQRHAIDEADHQHDQAGGGAHRRQRLFTDEVANDQRVHRVVKLLKQVTEEDWHREQQHLFGNAAHGKKVLVVCHFIATSLSHRAQKAARGCRKRTRKDRGKGVTINFLFYHTTGAGLNARCCRAIWAKWQSAVAAMAGGWYNSRESPGSFSPGFCKEEPECIHPNR